MLNAQMLSRTCGTTIDSSLCAELSNRSINIIGMFKNNLSEIGLSYVDAICARLCFGGFLSAPSTLNFIYRRRACIVTVMAFVSYLYFSFHFILAFGLWIQLLALHNAQ